VSAAKNDRDWPQKDADGRRRKQMLFGLKKKAQENSG
jgi:hypothetical protein